jgi:hypothetical protein
MGNLSYYHNFLIMNCSAKSNRAKIQRNKDFSYPREGVLYFDKIEENNTDIYNFEIFHTSSKICNSKFIQENYLHNYEESDLNIYLNNSEQTISQDTSNKIVPRSKNILDRIFE